MAESIAKRHKKKIIALALIVFGVAGAHVFVVLSSRMTPPSVNIAANAKPTENEGVRRLGASYTQVVDGVREVYLKGTPEEVGAAHVTLLRDHMVSDEGAVWSQLSTLVPFSPARTLMTDVGRYRYRNVDVGVPLDRKREIAAQAAAFQPDPFSNHMPTYERMIFLHSLYDIALSFEHSPLLGCSAFALGPERTTDGHALLARAFDFEAGDIYDTDKAVFFVDEPGTIPFASVAWPGLVGVLSGMNREGVAIVVHGGRAREPRTEGEPVVFTLREVLERAHDTSEAVAILSAQNVMVSHIVFVADAAGHFAIVERAPGEVAFVRKNTDESRVALTNHFEGPMSSDPKNQAIRAHTTTLARRAKLDEMLDTVGPHEGDVPRAIAMLRDHTCAKSIGPCDLGDRRAIDPFIATHGIVADTTAKILWVSAGPHLSGRFVAFDLQKIFAPDHDPASDTDAATVAEDPALHDGRYDQGRKRAGGPKFGGDQK
ncbi:MAG: C45 family autoproteolytic acyltransferase/hydrolase [Polyangiaceae bacterium]